jgi:RNA polymerase sigma factor for flagellar operon FliA
MAEFPNDPPGTPATAAPPEVVLWREYARATARGAGDRRVRDRLVVHYTPLVRQVASKLGARLPSHVELADLVQSGVFGLIEAIERFRPDHGVRFEVYAAQRIRGAILDELRSQDWVPRLVRDRARELAYGRERLEARLGRQATEAELAVELGVPLADVDTASSPLRMVSIDAVLQRAAESGVSVSVADAPAGDDTDPVARLEVSENRRTLHRSLANLEERDRQVLLLSYVENVTLARIGELLGVTESRVCKLRSRAINRLRGQFAELAGTAGLAGAAVRTVRAAS